jgi:hypothetical protein
MPRKQRFKPSRKPKPAEPSMDASANENRPVDDARTVQFASEQTTGRSDVSGET